MDAKNKNKLFFKLKILLYIFLKTNFKLHMNTSTPSIKLKSFQKLISFLMTAIFVFSSVIYSPFFIKSVYADQLAANIVVEAGSKINLKPVIKDETKTILVVEDETEVIPVVEDKPEVIPVVEDEPEVIPVVEDESEVIPVVEDEPEVIPAVEDEPEVVPVVEDKPEVIPVVEDKILERESLSSIHNFLNVQSGISRRSNGLNEVVSKNNQLQPYGDGYYHIEASDEANVPGQTGSDFYHWYAYGPYNYRGWFEFSRYRLHTDQMQPGDAIWTQPFSETLEYTATQTDSNGHYIFQPGKDIYKGVLPCNRDQQGNSNNPTCVTPDFNSDNTQVTQEIKSWLNVDDYEPEYAYMEFSYKVPSDLPQSNDAKPLQTQMFVDWFFDSNNNGTDENIGTLLDMFHRPAVNINMTVQNLTTGEEGRDILITQGDQIRFRYYVNNIATGRVGGVTVGYNATGAIENDLSGDLGSANSSLAGLPYVGYDNPPVSTYPASTIFDTPTVIAAGSGNITATAFMTLYYDDGITDNTVNWLCDGCNRDDQLILPVTESNGTLQVSSNIATGGWTILETGDTGTGLTPVDYDYAPGSYTIECIPQVGYTVSVQPVNPQVVTGNNTTIAQCKYDQYDLSIEKRVDDENVAPNLLIDPNNPIRTKLTYTITFSNLGEAQMTGVNVVDDYDQTKVRVSNVTLASDNGDTLIWDVGVLDPGETIIYSYEAELLDGVGDPTPETVNNSVQINANETELDLTNNIDNVSVNVDELNRDEKSKRVTNLRTGITSTVVDAVSGDELEYILTYRAGDTDVMGYVFRDDVSDIINSADIVDLGGGTLSGNEIIYDPIDILAYQEAEVRFNILIKDFQGCDANDLELRNTYGHDSTVVLLPCIEQDKNVSVNSEPYQDNHNSVAVPDDIVTYYLFAKNTGSGVYNDYVFEDNITDILEYSNVINTNSGIITINAQGESIISWTPVDVPAGSEVVKTFTVQVENPLHAGGDNVMQNNYGSATTIVTLSGVTFGTDLEITKTSDVQTAVIEDIITYTLNYKNNGTATGSNIVVSDVFNSDYVEVVNPGGGTSTGNLITWNLGDLPASQSGTPITYTMRVITPLIDVQAINDVSILSDEADLDLTDNISQNSVLLNATGLDLGIAKIADMTEADNNDVITYTLTYQNNGTSTGTNVQIVDTFNNAYLQVHNIGTGVVNGNQITWNVGAVAPNEVSQIIYTMRVITDEKDVAVNNVYVSSDIGDINPSNNQSSATVDLNSMTWNGIIRVTTNLKDSTHYITGLNTGLIYSGSGVTTQYNNVPDDTFTIQYGAVDCFNTPPNETSLVQSGSTLDFRAKYSYKSSCGSGGGGGSDADPLRGDMIDTIIKEVSVNGGLFKKASTLQDALMIKEGQKGTLTYRVTLINKGIMSVRNTRISDEFRNEKGWQVGEIKNVLGAEYDPVEKIFTIPLVEANSEKSFTYDVGIVSRFVKGKALINKTILEGYDLNIPEGMDRLTKYGIGEGDEAYVQIGVNVDPVALNSVNIRKYADKTKVNPGDIVQITIIVDNVSEQDLSGFELYDDYDEEYLTPLQIKVGADDGKGVTWKKAVFESGKRLEYRYKAVIKDNVTPDIEFATISAIKVKELDLSDLRPKVDFKVKAIDYGPISDKKIVLAQTGPSMQYSSFFLLTSISGLAVSKQKKILPRKIVT